MILIALEKTTILSRTTVDDNPGNIRGQRQNTFCWTLPNAAPDYSIMLHRQSSHPGRRGNFCRAVSVLLLKCAGVHLLCIVRTNIAAVARLDTGRHHPPTGIRNLTVKKRIRKADMALTTIRHMLKRFDKGIFGEA